MPRRRGQAAVFSGRSSGTERFAVDVTDTSGRGGLTKGNGSAFGTAEPFIAIRQIDLFVARENTAQT